jgi:hypothetical protein
VLGASLVFHCLRARSKKGNPKRKGKEECEIVINAT